MPLESVLIVRVWSFFTKRPTIVLHTKNKKVAKSSALAERELSLCRMMRYALLAFSESLALRFRAVAHVHPIFQHMLYHSNAP